MQTRSQVMQLVYITCPSSTISLALSLRSLTPSFYPFLHSFLEACFLPFIHSLLDSTSLYIEASFYVLFLYTTSPSLNIEEKSSCMSAVDPSISLLLSFPLPLLSSRLSNPTVNAAANLTRAKQHVRLDGRAPRPMIGILSVLLGVLPRLLHLHCQPSLSRRLLLLTQSP